MENSRVVYKDEFTVQLMDGKVRPIEDYARAFFMAAPSWLIQLMQLRHRLIKLFGLKTSEIPPDRVQILKSMNFEPGDEVGIFKVFTKAENEILLGQDDKHLDFRIALVAKDEGANPRLIMATSVVIKNQFGRVYFFFVKPFHRIIAPLLLKRIVNATTTG